MRVFSLLLFFLICFNLSAQDTLHSKFGKSLPANGTLRILIIYAEIDYDVNPSKDPQDNFKYKTWDPRELPAWKDEMADPFFNMDNSIGSLTQFYKESSFGNLTLLGDYVPFVVTVKESETNSSNQTHVYNQRVLEKICAEKEFATANGLLLKDFDLWTLTSFGKPKITPGIDSPSKIDHIMIIYRNIHSLPVNHGFTSQGSPAPMCKLNADTYSTFSCPDHLPFNVPKHEYAHLLMGDNNFHPYGKTARGQSYFMFQQAGRSLLSAANATLLTCNAWDRDRLGWKLPEKKFTISCLDVNGNEISTDLDPGIHSDAGIYYLRDFITTGDAIRIKLPVNNHENKYPQWLWIENHQTASRNGSRFDKFQYQDAECTEEATPGLYMFVQVSKDEKTGNSIYGGYANYIRSVIANGNYDWNIETVKVPNTCVSDVPHYPFIKWRPNPFTGSHYLENVLADFNNDGKLEDREEAVFALEKINGVLVGKLGGLGDAGNAFTLKGNNKISISTNPSTAPVLNPDYAVKRLGSPANRVILLNGISVEILEELNDGRIKVQVKFTDTDITEDVRWCADSVLLTAIKGSSGFSLNLLSKRKIHLDQGITPTRFSEPLLFNNKNVFANPTVMVCLSGSSVNLNEKSEIIVDNGSTLILENNCELNLNKGAKIIVQNKSKLILSSESKVNLKKKSRIIVDSTSSVHLNEGVNFKKERGAKIKIKGKRIN